MTRVLVLTSRGFSFTPERPEATVSLDELAALTPVRVPDGEHTQPAGSATTTAAGSATAVHVVTHTPRAFVGTPTGWATSSSADPGAGVTLDLADLAVLLACRSVTTIHQALAEAIEGIEGIAPGGAGRRAPDEARVSALHDHGLLAVIDADSVDQRRHEGSTQRTVNRAFYRRKQLVAAEQRRRETAVATVAPHRAPVIPVYEPITPPNLALGLILGVARSYDGGRLNDRYDFDPSWVVRPKGLARRLATTGPGVLLFSNYVWSHDHNLAVSKAVKAASPESICIHGGPDTPRYPADAEAYFRTHPDVDVAVRNEGELAVAEILDALDGRIEGRGGDLSDLAGIPGLVIRDRGQVTRTPDRERLADLDQLPSPYLDGTFDDFGDVDLEFVIIETNRGCPYGCTFCDWGSATLSRIRKFDINRVFAELEWAATHRVESVWLADANFGIFARDVEIAARMVDLKARHGYPKSFVACWAKNTTKHIEQIIRLFTDAEIPFACTLALQSVDAGVLEAVNRKNIKTSAYDELAVALRNAGATVASDIMLGLPGSSLDSFADDLQACIDREIFVTIYLTALLVNSPMNDPDYREQHRLESENHEVAPGQRRNIVVAASTFSRADHAKMLRWRRMYRVFENASLLRFVARWVRHATGIREIDFYIGIERAASADPNRFPLTHWVLTTMSELCEPGDWAWFFDEIRRHIVDDLLVDRSGTDGSLPSGLVSALDTAIAVQAAFAPAWCRVFPLRLDIPHDYAAWYLDVRKAHEVGDDWTTSVAPLHTYGPGVLVVDDTGDANASLMGSDVLLDYFTAAELDAPMKRGRLGVAVPL